MKKPPNGKCQRCGKVGELTNDHIIPVVILKILCVAEKNSRDNIQYLCQPCNTLKAHSLDPKNPKTMPLLRKYVNRYEEIYVTKRSRRNYVFRTLPVKSLTPNVTHLWSSKKALKAVYRKQKCSIYDDF